MGEELGGEFDLERYDASALQRRSGVKWHRHGEGVLAAWVADMDYPLAPEVTAAIRSALDADDLGYPDRCLDAAVRAAHCSWALARHGLELDPAQLVVVSDVVQAIYLALLTLTEPGDAVVFLTPAYPPFFAAVEETGRRVVTCDLLPGASRYELDRDRLAAVVRREKVRCLLLCNPHNPTGRCLEPGELDFLAQLACEEDLLVLSDEIHADLALPGAVHLAMAGRSAEVAARCVSFFSASKSFNTAGLRCAVAAFGSAALKERFERFPPHARGGVSVPGMLASVAAWEHGSAWLEAVIERLAGNRDLVAGFVREHLGEVRHFPPEGTYLAWLDLSATGLGEDPAAWLRERAGIALSPGPEFGPAGRGHARLNFATPRPVLEEVLARLESGLRRHRAG